MRKVPLFVTLLLGAAPALSPVAQACGDKFLMVGRGARFNRAYAAIYPATILLYAPAGHRASTGILDPKFQASLTRAGHHLEVANDEELLARTLQTGRLDLVLADVSDVDAIKLKAQLSPSKPIVLPVTYKPTKSEAEAIKARYQSALKSSDRPDRYLLQIDREMQTRVQLRAMRRPS